MREALCELLKPIREKFASAEMKALVARAYPSEVEEAKQTAPESKRVDKPAPASASKGTAAKADKVDISRVDLRVGRIVSVDKHPDADSLYVETVDLGEAAPRTVVSGLVKYMPKEALQDRLAVFVCNLKPAVRTRAGRFAFWLMRLSSQAMRGVKSEAMLLAASDADNTKVELVIVPEGAKPGDRVTVEGYEGEPDEVRPVAPDLRPLSPPHAAHSDTAPATQPKAQGV